MKHIPKRVHECLMLRKHSIIAIIFSPIDFKRRLGRRDTNERFHLSTAQDKVKNPTKDPWYDHINLFGKSRHASTLVLPRIFCIASGLALLEDEQKFKLGGCFGTHKTAILCASISSECMK
jgi:hypothetical protein